MEWSGDRIAYRLVYTLLTVCRNAPILREAECEQMNKGLHVPTFELPEHGKLRVKSEIGELLLLFTRIIL